MPEFGTKNGNDCRAFRKRCLVLSLLLGAWLAAALAMNFTLAGPERQKYLELGRKLALHRAEYYAPRARLLDRDGVPLAWSERYFDLYCLVRDEELTPEIRQQLEQWLKPLPEPPPDRETPWKRGLTPSQILALEKWNANCRILEIRPRLERIRVNLSPELRESLGEVRLENGRQRGISGAEKEFDAILAGAPGSYEVMLDRHRNWIPGTWHEQHAPRPGTDVRLPFQVGR